MKYRTGIQQLDSVLRGGVPSGVCEVFGEDSSGKSTLCFSVIREASSRGLPTSIIHSDGMPDRDYISSCGAGDSLIVVPAHIEATVRAAVRMLEGGVKVIAIDNLSVMECSADLKVRDVGERVKSACYEALTTGLAEIAEVSKKNNAVVLIVNQIRTPIGSLNPKPTSFVTSAG